MNSWGYTGNAMLIAPNWVLTAASGETFTLNDNSFYSAQMVVNPGWNGNAFDVNASADYGDVGGFARISAFTPWICSVLSEPSVAATLLLASRERF
jgi:hypothetical protein